MRVNEDFIFLTFSWCGFFNLISAFFMEEEQTEAKLEALLKKSRLVISLHDINLFEEK